jgi:ammonia channel protein AmtB
LTGSWKWGGGWLNEMGFDDFAGSTVVHAFGGFAALACAIILGPRTGKYTPSGITPIPGHIMPLVAIGAFAFPFSFAVFFIFKLTMGVRVNPSSGTGPLPASKPWRIGEWCQFSAALPVDGFTLNRSRSSIARRLESAKLARFDRHDRVFE